MAVTRTAKGTTSDKISGTTLTLSSISCTIGDALIVFVANQTTNVPTSVKWGVRDLVLSRQRTNATSGHVASIWIARHIVNTATRNITVTWGTSIVAKAMAASTLDAGHVRDSVIGASQTASTAPSVGPSDTLTVNDCFAFGVLASEGPSSDTAPTLSGSWSSGQRIGTAGVPPISNITLLECYQQLSDNTAVTLSGTGATERDWANVLVVYRPIREAIAIDVNGVEILVDDTVIYEGSNTSTVSSIHNSPGHPFVKITLANGLVYNAHTLEVVG